MKCIDTDRAPCLAFASKHILVVLAAILILGQASAVRGAAATDANQPVQCSEQQCIPSVLIHSDDDSGRTRILIVEKQSQTAALWTKDGRWQKLAQWRCSTGKLQGRKAIEGDLKTPEGIYFVMREVPGRFLSETYGSRALPLDYPNWQDRTANRGGSAIWLHGTNKPLKPLDSNGCIVFKNRSIDALARWIKPRRTPVILVDSLRWQAPGTAGSKARTILPILTRWQQALMGGSYQRLKQWYASAAAPSMAWWHRWCRLRNKTALERGTYRSLIRNRLVIQYDDQVMVLFDHFLQRGQKAFWGGRIRMYISVAAHRVRILKTSYLDHDEDAQAAIATDPLFHAWRRMSEVAYSRLVPVKGSGASHQAGF